MIWIHFIRPWWLLALLACMIYCLYNYNHLNTGSWFKLFSNQHYYCKQGELFRWTNQRKAHIRCAFAPILFFCSVVIVLAGPSWKKTEKTMSRPPSVIVIDASQQPEKISEILHETIELLSPSPVGLIAFRGSAHTIAPLTEDKYTLHHLRQVISADIMPLPGNRPELGVKQAGLLLEQSCYKQGNIFLIVNRLLTHQQQAIKQILKNTPFSLTVFQLSKESAASSITITKKFLLQAANHNSEWKDCGYYLFPVIIVAFLLTCRKQIASIAIFILCLSFFSGSITSAYADMANQKQTIIQAAEKAWQKGHYQRAAHYFGLLHTAEAYYNQGNALAKAYKLSASIDAYNKALNLRPAYSDAYFNRQIVMRILARYPLKDTAETGQTHGNNIPDIQSLNPAKNDLKAFFKRKLAIELKEQQRKQVKQ